MSGLTFKEHKLPDGRITIELVGGEAVVLTRKTVVWPPAPDKIIKHDGSVVYRDHVGNKRKRKTKE